MPGVLSISSRCATDSATATTATGATISTLSAFTIITGSIPLATTRASHTAFSSPGTIL